jgi:hypothetical protein
LRKARNLSSHESAKATISIADEISKLAKLKEQRAITEEEFLQLKRESNEENVNYYF